MGSSRLPGNPGTASFSLPNHDTHDEHPLPKMTSDTDQLPGVPAPDAKPEMTRKDASFHLAQAASDARKRAAGEGSPEHEVDVLMSTDPVTIGPFQMQRMGARVVWALEEANKCFVKAETDMGNIFFLAVTVFGFTEPQQLYKMARARKAEEIEAKAIRLATYSGGATESEMRARITQLWALADAPRVEAWLP